MIRRLATAALLGALAGCARGQHGAAARTASDSAGATVPTASAPTADPQSPRPLGSWSRSEFTAPTTVVLRDQAALAEFWRRVGAGDVPSIDFSREAVIGAALGERRTGGYAVRIGAIKGAEGGAEIEVVEEAPGPDCMSTMSLTQPAAAAAVPKEAVTGTVRFTRRIEKKPCG
jgi:hypothetical protein